MDDDPGDSPRRVLTTTRLSDDYWHHRGTDDFPAVTAWFDMLEPEQLATLCDALEHVLTGPRSNTL